MKNPECPDIGDTPDSRGNERVQMDYFTQLIQGICRASGGTADERSSYTHAVHLHDTPAEEIQVAEMLRAEFPYFCENVDSKVLGVQLRYVSEAREPQCELVCFDMYSSRAEMPSIVIDAELIVSHSEALRTLVEILAEKSTGT